MPQHHNAESPPWEPQIYLPNYVTLCKTYDAHYGVWVMRYNMWGSHSDAHWWEFKSSEMWHHVWTFSILLDHGAFIVRVRQSRKKAQPWRQRPYNYWKCQQLHTPWHSITCGITFLQTITLIQHKCFYWHNC